MLIADYPSLWRRLLALVYDLVVIIALLFVAGFAALLFTGGKAVPSGNHWFQLWLLLVLVGYFAVAWRYGGQTMGMRSWRLRLVSADGGPMRWKTIARRLLTGALLGLPLIGYLGCLHQSQRQSWQDSLGGTLTVLLSKD